jgi:hypothetical protein
VILQKGWMSSQLTKSARGEPCMIRLEGCNAGPNNETVILAHLNGGGMGMKVHDLFGFYSCFSCHDVFDNRVQHNYDKEWLELQGYRAMVRTQEKMIEKGLIRYG